MAQLKIGIVEGWTAPLDFQLYNGTKAEDLTNTTVIGVARNRLRASVDLSSDVAVITATDGIVRLVPDLEDFPESGSPYELRFRVRDSSTQDAYFPSEEAILLEVRP